MDPVLIPPGRTQLWKCPEGSMAGVSKGDVLKSQDKDAIFVVDVTSEGVILGPLVAGDLEVTGLCKDQGAVTFRVEAPDPEKVQKELHPMSPIAMAYPWWFWIAITLIVFAVGAIAWFVRRLLLPKAEGGLDLSRTRIRKTPSEKMEIFLSKIDAQQIVNKDDVASAQMLYGEGLRLLRALLQEAYNFKAPGATTTEFIAEVKAIALRKPSILQTTQIAQLESTFMQAKQVSYARETPELALRSAYRKSLKEFSDILISRIASAQAAAAPTKRKTLLKKKGTP